jgi:hypothetical protein
LGFRVEANAAPLWSGGRHGPRAAWGGTLGLGRISGPSGLTGLWLALLVSWCISGVAHAAPAADVRYNRDIRPILSENCFYCHGPDQNKRKAKLRLDVREEALARKAFVPGNPDESELVRRIFSADDEELMPPPKSQKKLSQAQKELLRRWISEGAAYERHWAYIRPTRPAAPSGSAGIDFLVQARLKEVGLAQSRQADRRTLARRLYFDLLGLPPRPGDVETFEQDAAPDAYQKLVEELLASPRYGERMAIGWLDVVRYADTIGYHSDNPRQVWPYRDYVIRSFNENKPFDQFTREQLAGDLLPNSTLEEKVGSAFNRLLLSTEEGGAQPKDYEARMLTDRVRAVGTVWLAQTFGCCQCHDHKFDPIKSRDFYSMGAFFADIKEPIIGRREDGMLVPTSKQAEELSHLQKELAPWRQKYEAARPELLSEWERSATQVVAAETNWTSLKPEEAVTESGVKLRVDPDGTITVEKNPPHGTDTYRIRVRAGLAGLAGFRLEVLTSDQMPSHGPGRGKEGRFVVTRFAVQDNAGNPVELDDASATYTSPGSDPLQTIDGGGHLSEGWSVRDMPGVPQAIYFSSREAVDADDSAELTFLIRQTAGNNQVIGRFRLSATTNPDAVRAPATTLPPPEIAQILRQARAQRTTEQEDKLAAYHRSIAPELADLRHQFAVAQKAADDFEATVGRCLVSVQSEKPRTVRILPRGNWMIETGDIVEAALPGYLVDTNSVLEGRGLNRLDLANWLVSRENPLTARVFVNRLWKQYFGIGLSKVLDDFGAQGEPPPNQPLLDWLACEFIDSGWDVKHLVRLMVNSETYRQVSTASRLLQSRDPDNREVARQGRWRLDAELIRDDALSIAGLLELRIGGPSVKPYQPDGYWENLNFPVRTYDASQGPDQYRRGLYTWWQRSYLHPSFLAFDAPTREECAAERSRSNIPQQALVLLNDPTYVEAARAFAERIVREGGTNSESRIGWAWQQALDRPPRPDELETMQGLVGKLAEEYAGDRKAAEDLLKVGQHPAGSELDPAELAAWTNVARVLLNLHETITRS